MSAVDNPAEAPVPATSGEGERGDGGITVEVDASDVGVPGRVGQLEAALAKAEQEKKENWDKYLRAVADLENFRKRAKRDLDDARAEAKTRVLKEMLPVVDNLERAVEHAEKDGDASAGIVDGLKLVMRQFLTAFERADVTPIEAANQPFDPNLHEAISQLETDAHPPGTIVQVLQRGYRLGDRLLRPALVVVAKTRAGAQE